MKRINFINDQEPALDDVTLNQLQDNIENEVITSKTTDIAEDLTITDCAEVNGKLDIKDGKTIQEGTPTPDTPIDIRNVGDNVNLFDISTITAGKYVNAGNGTLGSSTVSNTSDYIKVKANTTLTLSYEFETLSNEGKKGFCFYNENKTYLSGVEYNLTNNNKEFHFTVANDGYVRFSYDKNITKIKLEKGSKATGLTEYGCGSIDIKTENNKTYNNCLSLGMSYSTSKILETTDYKGLYIKLEENKKVLSMARNKITNRFAVCFTETEPTNNTTFFGAVGTDGSYYSSNKIENITIPSNAKYVFVYLSNSKEDCSNVDIQIEYSNTIKDYQSKTVVFPLSKGQLIHKGDYLAEDGIHQSKGTLVLDGTENWTIGTLSSSENKYYFTIPVDNMKPNSPYSATTIPTILCTHFQAENNANMWTKKEDNKVVVHDSSNKVQFTYFNCTTVEQWKTYLAEQYANGTPVTVGYELATETITPYTPEQEQAYYELQHLLMYEGYTNIECIDEIKPDIQVTYLYNNELNKAYGKRFDEVDNNIKELDNRDIYSTEEQVIGKWIDEKPLYRKVFKSSTFSTSYNIPITNTDEIISIKGLINRKDYPTMIVPIPSRVTNTSYIVDYVSLDKGSTKVLVTLAYGTGWSESLFSEVTFIIEYTKTTN